MSRAGGFARVSLATKIRLGFAVISALYAVLAGTAMQVLPWVLLVTALDLGATGVGSIPGQRARARTTQLYVLLGAAAACAGVAFHVAGGAAAPLALIPAYHAGLRFGLDGFRRAVAIAAGAALLSSALVTVAPPLQARGFAAWMTMVVALGVLGAWSHRITAAEVDEGTQDNHEAIALIQRLHELADSSDTGFDAPARASSALAELAGLVPSERSVLLVSDGHGRLAPVALRGVTRVPWQSGLTDSEPLGAGWAEAGPRVLNHLDDLGARSVLAVPIVSRVEGDHESTTGLILADRPAGDPFTSVEVARGVLVARHAAPALDAALLFASLRERASLEERHRLAREMHDGVAQNLAALGFQIDAVRMRAGSDSSLKTELQGLRASLGESLRDLRSHISALSFQQRPETGLGALLGAAVQTFGAATGVRTTTSIAESLLRLPSHLEMQVYRVAMDVLADAQLAGATEACVVLCVEPPQVHLEIGHNGATSLSHQSFAASAVVRGGGSVRVDTGPLGNVNVVVDIPAADGVAAAAGLTAKGAA